MSAIRFRLPTLLAVLCSFAHVARAQWPGSGTEADPYLVFDAAGLNAIGASPAQWDKHYQLIANIDLAGAQITPAIGTFSEGFSGVLDGAGFEIQNLVSDRAGVVVLNWGTVRDLTVRDGELRIILLQTNGGVNYELESEPERRDAPSLQNLNLARQPIHCALRDFQGLFNSPTTETSKVRNERRFGRLRSRC